MLTWFLLGGGGVLAVSAGFLLWRLVYRAKAQGSAEQAVETQKYKDASEIHVDAAKRADAIGEAAAQHPTSDDVSRRLRDGSF